MTIKFMISMMKGSTKKGIIAIVIAFFITSLHVNAQEQRPFVAHEVIEIGGGQKIEILRCRGEGPLEECDCIYYTDKRQNGKRQWQNANQIRQEQKAAQLEVAAAKELAKSEAQKMAEAKAREAAERKAAKEKERTASAETNAVLETLKDQNELKTKGVVKANTYRGSVALAKQKEQAEEKRKNALSLQEIARQRDSINRLKTVKQDEPSQSDIEEDEYTVNKAKLMQPTSPVAQQNVKKPDTPLTQNEVKASVTEKAVVVDTSDVVDFETLRKQEEAKGNVSYVPPAKTETEEKAVQKENKKENEAEKKVEPKSETPAPEQEPAPKPAKPETPVVDTPKQELIIDTASTEGNVEVPPTDTIVSPESDTTHKAADAEVKSDENGGQITEENVSETIKNEMVENEENIVKDEEVKKEKVKKEKKEKKPKKPKKDKKKKVEEITEDSPAVEPAPLEERELTPLQKAARTSDSIQRSKSKTDTTTAPEPPQENVDFGHELFNNSFTLPEIIVTENKLWINKNNSSELILQEEESKKNM